jgi:eukaryotic-like serine/threonine-protein kinase
MGFELGQTVGDYEFIDIVSSSRSSIAYKVRNTLAQRFELLRVLRHMQDDPAKRDRFVREIKVLARIHHVNIVSFFHATQLDGELVLTTELVEGSTLAERLELGRMPIMQALEYIAKVLAALECAHAQGVIHRDVTPENIVITTEGDIKLTGFSLAKTISDPQLTQAGTVLGSLHYMSPEQVKGLPTLDARTDIYATGTILYEMVTGTKAFPGQSQFEVMFANVNSEPVPLERLNPEVPPQLSQIILAAMEKDPADRLQSAAEFRKRIERILEPACGEPETTRMPSGLPEAHVLLHESPAFSRASGLSPAGMFWAGVFVFAFAVLLFFALMRLP